MPSTQRVSIRRLIIGVIALGLLVTGLTTLPAAADDTATLESGLTFNGLTQYVQFAKPLPQAPQTIELWLKIPNAGNKREIIYSNYSDASGVSIELSTAGQLRYYERLGAIDFTTGPDLRDDQWHHVVLERDLADSTVTFYVDGTNVGTKSVTFPSTTVVPTVAHWLGQDVRASMRFQGEIGELRDWSTLRTPDELQATSTTELTGDETGLMDDWELDEPYDPTATSYVIHDKGPDAIDGTAFGYTPPKGPTQNILDVDFANGSPVEHTQGLPITTYGTPTISQDSGAGGDVATFNGTTDAYSIPLADQWPKLLAGLTTECVFRLNAAPTGSDYLCSGANGGGIDMWVNGTTLTYGLFVAGAYRRATATIALNTWYDAVMVWDGASVILYLNGTPIADVAAAGAVGLPTPAAAQDLILGADAATDGTFENPAAVSIERAQIWDGPLTADQVAALDDLPQTTPPSGTDDTANLESGLSFDGSSQYVKFAKPLPVAPETIELWVKIPNAGNKREIIYSNYSGDPTNGFGIELTVNGQLRYYERNGAIDFVTGPDLRDDTWHHVVLERDLTNNTVTFYVDGTEIGTEAVTFPPTTIAPSAAHYLGQDYRATMRFQGEIGELRDWSYVRTPDELAATATTELSGDEPGLMDDWGLDDAFATGATDNVVHDSGPDANNGTLLGFSAPVPLLTHTLSTPAVSAGSQVSQSVAGLWSLKTTPTFTKVSGDSWLQVSADGVVTGTPTSKQQGTTGVITIKADDGSFTDTITVEVPVLGKSARPEITAASWNLWDNGSHVTDGLVKEVAAITESGLDVIGVQGSDGTGAKQLADALGWYSYQSGDDLGIVSAYPISNVTEPTTDTPAAGVTITVNGQQVRVWVAHLDESSDATRTTQANAITTEIAPDLASASTTPVILLGDLATTSTSVTDIFTTAGLTDTGVNDGATYNLVAAAGATDRVDYVDYRGGLRVLGSESYYTGWPSATETADDDWPSDHAAAVTVFELSASKSAR